MKSGRLILGAIALAGALGFAASGAMSQQSPVQDQPKQLGQPMAGHNLDQSRSQGQQFLADKVIGKKVVNANGKEIGEVADIMIAPKTGNLTFILNVGGFLGIGERKVAFDADKLDVQKDRVVLKSQLTEDQIKNMPEFNAANYEAIRKQQR